MTTWIRNIMVASTAKVTTVSVVSGVTFVTMVPVDM